MRQRIFHSSSAASGFPLDAFLSLCCNFVRNDSSSVATSLYRCSGSSVGRVANLSNCTCCRFVFYTAPDLPPANRIRAECRTAMTAPTGGTAFPLGGRWHRTSPASPMTDEGRPGGERWPTDSRRYRRVCCLLPVACCLVRAGGRRADCPRYGRGTGGTAGGQ